MTLVRKLRDHLATHARALPVARHAWARYRRRRYERRIRRFLDEGTGRADRLPMGAVYEATMRCNLHCEFCYVGDLLNLEGEWRQELTIEELSKAFPAQKDFQISLTGGEIFMRKDIMSVLDLFREKGYAAGYLTTNGTIITEERADALAELAAKGFLKHISVSVDGPKDVHDIARGLKGTFERTTEGLKRLQAAARRKNTPLRVSINTTVAHESLEALDQMVDVAEELGDLTKNSLEEVWNGEKYVAMRGKLLEHGIFPVCRRCCKVELSPVPAVATADLPRRRAIPMTVVHN